MALTRQGLSSAPVGKPRDASALLLGVPWNGAAASAPAVTAQGASAPAPVRVVQNGTVSP
jgi:hypothetical protein